MKPIENARLSVPVTIQDIRIVSSVPINLQLIDFTILRFGLSEFLSLE